MAKRDILIYIVMGQCGSGKSTYIKERFKKENVTYTKCGNAIIFSRYDLETRTGGLDLLTPKSLLNLIAKIAEFYHQYDYLVVEGQFVLSETFVSSMARYNCEVLYLQCEIETSESRLNLANSIILRDGIERSRNVCLKFYEKYKDVLKFNIIKTD